MLGIQKAQPRVFNINAEWDEFAGVWVVTSVDLPGLVTEAVTQDELRQKLCVMAPELLELNCILPCGEDDVPIELQLHSEQRVALGF